MFKIRIVTLSAVFAMFLSLSVDTNAKMFNGEEFFLANGMQVIVIPNHKAPIIKHMVWYKSGSIDEKLGKGGVAHLLEHLMFRGTSNVKANQLNQVLEENGAESNAFTGLDMTAYHQFLDISRLELAMFLEADRMQNLTISDKDFALERDIVFQERKQVVDNNPTAQFAEKLRKVLWLNHPYARPITGEEEEILSLTIDDIKDFYNKYYAPNNAVLILSGDISVAMAKKLAEKHYGKLLKKTEIHRKILPVLEASYKSKVEMSKPQIKGLRVSKSFAAPSYNHNKKEVYNLALLSAYLGEGETSKLYKKLVIEQKKALSISTSYNPISRSYGSFSISAIPQDSVSPEELMTAIDQAIENSMNELNFDELEKVKGKMLAGLVYLRDNPEDAAMIVGSMAVMGVNLNEIETQNDKIKEVNYKNVKNSAVKLFDNTPHVVGVLKPAKGGENVTSSTL